MVLVTTRALYASVFFAMAVALVYFVRPRWMFDPDGTPAAFGIADPDATPWSFGSVVVLLAVGSFYLFCVLDLASAA